MQLQEYVIKIALFSDKPSLLISPSSLTAVDGSLDILTVQVYIDANPFPIGITVTTPHHQATPLITCPNKTASTVSVILSRINRYNAGNYTVMVTNMVDSAMEEFAVDVHCKLEYSYSNTDSVLI